MLDIMLKEVYILDKHVTQKKDKFTYRPWRQFNSCYGCGRSLKNYPQEQKFCDGCRIQIHEGYEIY